MRADNGSLGLRRIGCGDSHIGKHAWSVNELTGPIRLGLSNAAQVEIIFISLVAVRWALSSCRRSSAALSMSSALGADFLTAGVSILRFSCTFFAAKLWFAA
jgi:hypothetical protein